MVKLLYPFSQYLLSKMVKLLYLFCSSCSISCQRKSNHEIAVYFIVVFHVKKNQTMIIACQ